MKQTLYLAKKYLTIASKLAEMVERYAEIAEDESETVRYYLHPISRMHLYSKIDMPGFTGDAGSYPALYLSAFEPATVLKGGAIKAGSAQARVRKGLVVLQFAISIVLIIGTIIVADQMRLIRKKDLGFNKDEVVVASIFRQDRYQSDGGQLQKQYLQIKDAFAQHPNITTVSATSHLPGNS